MLKVSFIAIGKALCATCHYRQEVLDKCIGACTNNHAASIDNYAASIAHTEQQRYC